MHQPIEKKTGGKLYLAGEYAILIPYQTAIIHFIPLYLTAQIKKADTIQLSSDYFSYTVDMTADANYGLIQDSINLLLDYKELTLQEIPSFSLRIIGNLAKDKKKFGIGSSGSVTVLTLKTLAAFLGLSLSLDELFKLASCVLIKRGDNGSMGDLACITYEQMIAYTAFDRKAISHRLRTEELQDVIASDWGYTISPITPRLTAHFMVGWTQEPALSHQMIKDVRSAITSLFLQNSETVVNNLKIALETGDEKSLLTYLQEAGQLLSQLSPAIMTSKLQELVAATQPYSDAAGKSSGAGGGDCGIALALTSSSQKAIMEAWSQAGITLLYQERWFNDQS